MLLFQLGPKERASLDLRQGLGSGAGLGSVLLKRMNEIVVSIKSKPGDFTEAAFKA